MKQLCKNGDIYSGFEWKNKSILESRNTAPRVTGNLYDPELRLERLQTPVLTNRFLAKVAGCRDVPHLAFMRYQVRWYANERRIVINMMFI